MCTWSRMPGCARPVRTLCSSLFNASTERAIFCSAVFLMSAILMTTPRSSSTPIDPPRGSRPASGGRALGLVKDSLLRKLSCLSPASSVNEGTFVLAQDHALECSRLVDAEHLDRQLLVAAECERSRVHHLQILDDRFIEADLAVARRVAVFLRVGGIDAVDLGRFQHDLRADLRAAQRRRRVGRAQRVAG